MNIAIDNVLCMYFIGHVQMDESPVVNAVRLGFTYLFVITLTIIVQSIANKLMRLLADALWPTKFVFKSTITMILLLYIVFSALLIDTLIWTAFIMFSGVFTDFITAFTFSVDNFTTLGGDDPLESPWEYLGPVISLNGIVIIAFAVSAMYDALYKAPDKPDCEEAC